MIRPVVRGTLGLLIGLAASPALAVGADPVRLPDGTELGVVDFDRHVAGLFGRLGCNTGACHGSFQGRGGLQLSLFGHDPARDYRSLTRDAMGRRVAPLDPDRSLLLLKGSGQVPHEGGQRFATDSWEYRVIRAWIAGGARRDAGASPAEAIEIRPNSVAFAKAGESARLAVVARFADGASADVTPFCDLRAKDDAVVEVLPGGRVRSLGPGETALIASYRGLLASTLVTVPTGRIVDIPEAPVSDLIDSEVDARLRALGIAPSGPSSDAEFLRRASLDVIGALPSPEEVRAFLDDQSPAKRSRKIDALLAHPMHAALWATRYLDITGCDVDSMEKPDQLRPRRASMWHDWFRKRFAENQPYDEIARGILCATSRDGKDVETWIREEATRMLAARAGSETDYASKPGLDLFWRRYVNDEYFPIEQMAERTAVALMGVRLECAQCHKHPFDRWTQTDYRSFANVFAKVQFGHSPTGLAATARLLEERRKTDPGGQLAPIPRLQEVYVADRPSRRLLDPASGQSLTPRALGGPEFSETGDPRDQLFAWLKRADNPYFAPSFVNRAWAAYFGVGLVDPVDGFSVANPPSNARLLDALSADFIAHGFDIRRLERMILSSKAYQRSSVPVEGAADDRAYLACSSPRPMMAEVLVDVLNDALGVAGDFGPDAPRGARAIEVASNRVASADLARVFRIFGRPQRTATCDCERPKQPAVSQALFLMTDTALLDKIRKGRLRVLLDSERCDAEIVEELVLATLSRLPRRDEFDAGLEHLRENADRSAAMADILWAIINTREFVLNH
jgi:Protein of unknown function (DUF1549)/Protein of unknown function (DUF1553)